MAKPGNHATVPGGQGKALAAQDKQLGLPISFRPSLVNKYFPQYNGAVGKKISAVAMIVDPHTQDKVARSLAWWWIVDEKVSS